MSDAFINSKVFHWALKRSDLTIDDIAEHFSLEKDKVKNWGLEECPTFRQAQTLAQKLHIPFGFLFLTEPPSEDLPIPDLRTLKNKEFETPSADFSDLLNDVLEKFDWYKEHLQKEKNKKLSFVGKY